MSSRLSCHKFLFSIKERSGLRDQMKNKKIRCESREGIQARKEIYFPFLNKNGVKFKLNAAQFLLLPPSERKDVIVERTTAVGADIEGHIL